MATSSAQRVSKSEFTPTDEDDSKDAVGGLKSSNRKVITTPSNIEIQTTAQQSYGAPATEASDDGMAMNSSQTGDDKPTLSRRSILEEHGLILGKVIGYGSYAKVKMAYSEELGREVAVKIISKFKAPPEYTKKFLPREINAVKGLHHENMIQFYQSIETSHRVYLVMQIADNGTVLDYIRERKYLDEAIARKLFRQLISVIAYCHSKGVVHRDIKCENLLLDAEYNLKIIDFGFARNDMLSADNSVVLSKTFCGSYAYASPEILKAVAYNPFMSDIWATGVVCYAMVFGRLPFDGSNLTILLQRVTSTLVFPKIPKASTECKHLIFHILAPLKIRYRIPQIQDDPWFNAPCPTTSELFKPKTKPKPKSGDA